ncbi:hypothetical protein [Polyangium mundeleinium]|uniref:Uncharacterized protein n=1 Tax=Polyangium mundeleinium TaxID=2995306 RepID=A0ABT5EM43_9BACT|nr:hypothetical protein [Polyangium mundeleinium]MDC0742836.1 hypothetical protein [Polyangium mundeleinium]
MQCGGEHGGPGHGGMASHEGHGSPAGAALSDDRAVFHFLLANREVIQRQVTRLPDGVATVTESDDPAVAQRIREHVKAMHLRLQEKRPIHVRDPLFAATFANAEKVKMTIETTPRGVRVVETSTDPQVVALIQAHADVVTAFLERGHVEVRKNHPVPEP